jgi:hypothetical protein
MFTIILITHIHYNNSYNFDYGIDHINMGRKYLVKKKTKYCIVCAVHNFVNLDKTENLTCTNTK